LFNIPNAANEIPKVPKSLNEIYEVTLNAKTGTIVDKYPNASPKIMLVAAPV